MQENQLMTERVSTLCLKFCIPAVISMAIAGMQTMVDGLFVGNVIGSDAMASVNIASPFMQLIIGISMVMSIGAQSYMGLTFGEGNEKKGQNIFKTSVILITIMGILVTVLGVFYHTQLASLLGANEVLFENVSIYIKTLAFYAVPMMWMFLFGFSNRIINKPELYFKAMIVSLVANVLLNYILIARLELGMIGAATATGLSYIAALIIVAIPMLNQKSAINIFSGTFDKTTIKPVLYNGSSEGINSIAAAVCAYVFNMAFMSVAGEDGVAAFTAINYIAYFGILLMFGISDGIGPLISYNYGSRQFERVHDILKIAYKGIGGVAIFIFIILIFFGRDLATLFIQGDTLLLDLAEIGAKIYAFSFLFNGFNIVYSGFFTAIGHARASVIVAAARGLLFILIGIFILPKLFGLNGVWLTVPFAEGCTFVISLQLLKTVHREMAQYSIEL